MRNIRSWRELKVMLKWRFPTLNDTDFYLEEENKEDMLTQLCAKLNKTRPEFELLLAELQGH